MVKTLHFKSKAGFRKAMAHIHIHDEAIHHHKGHFPQVMIAGKPHHVEHGRDGMHLYPRHHSNMRHSRRKKMDGIMKVGKLKF